MRLTIFQILGVLELAVAGVVVYLGLQLPSEKEIARGFDGADRATRHAGRQVRVLRQQIDELRRPELQQLARRLQKETRTVTATLKKQHVDFNTVQTVCDSLGNVASGLDSLSKTLDPGKVGQLGNGLEEAAGFLDRKVAPSAERAADQLEKSSALLQKDARRLALLVREAPLDLKAAREVHDSLGKFALGLDKMSKMMKLPRFDAMRDGFSGLEDSLTIGADQVERMARFTYPVVNFNGFRPEINQRQFWPEGDRIAEGMRKAAKGVTAASKEMDGLAKDLPELRASLDESRKVVDKTREALATALKQQDLIEPLLKDVPQHAARLAEELPRLGTDLAKILRDTKQLKEVAAALREAQKGIESAVASWPELRTTLSQAATLLRTTRDQLDEALNHRQEYEAALRQTVVLADSFATLLPLITEQLDRGLGEEEQILDEMGQSLDEVNDALPAYHQTTSRMVQAGRLLAWLVAAFVGVHGAFLVLSGRLGRQFSP